MLSWLFKSRSKIGATNPEDPAEPLSLDEVFPESAENVPYTYVSRPKVEKDVADCLSQNNSIILFSGPSKTGKTVLARRLSGNLPQAHIHAFSTMTSDEFWTSLRVAIEAPDTKERRVEQASSMRSVDGREIGGGVEAGFLQFGGKSHIAFERGELTARAELTHIELPGRIGVIEHLKKHPHIIIIDDYHWMNPDLVEDIFPPLKQTLSLGSKVVLISVSDRAFPTMGDLSDFNGRLLSVKMPRWELDEIQQIGDLGFSKLNVHVSRDTIESLASCSYYSPLLMQGLCKEYCKQNDVFGNQIVKKELRHLGRDQVGRSVAVKLAAARGAPYQSALDGTSPSRWPTKDRDGNRLLTIQEIFLLGLSHKQPFEPISLEDMKKRILEKILNKNEAPQNLPALLAKRAVDLQSNLGGRIGDRSPILYDKDAQQVTIVDPYFKLWVRWVKGEELGGNLF
jgi:hypothetical protein